MIHFGVILAVASASFVFGVLTMKSALPEDWRGYYVFGRIPKPMLFLIGSLFFVLAASFAVGMISPWDWAMADVHLERALGE